MGTLPFTGWIHQPRGSDDLHPKNAPVHLPKSEKNAGWFCLGPRHELEESIWYHWSFFSPNLHMFIGSWKVNWKVNSPPKLLGESPRPLKIILGRWSTAKSPRSSLPSTNTGRTSSDASDGQALFWLLAKPQTVHPKIEYVCVSIYIYTNTMYVYIYIHSIYNVCMYIYIHMHIVYIYMHMYNVYIYI